MHTLSFLGSLTDLSNVLAVQGAVGAGWIWTILIGFIIGFVAKFLTPGKDPAGFFITTIIGILGSVLAYYLGSFLGWYHDGETPGFIASVIGAVILLALYHLVRRNSSGPTV